ncbi:MAG: hypothetical protein ACOX88_10405 [Christensenellales bacterium]|jgi:hypothetical protein
MDSSVQTMSTWTIFLNQARKVPIEFRKAFDATFAGKPFPYVLLCPDQRLNRPDEDVKLCALSDDALYVFEKGYKPVVIALNEVILIEHQESLLYSHLRVLGKKDEVFVPFNAVSYDYFEPIIQTLRKLDDPQIAQIPDALRALQEQSFKFTTLGTGVLKGARPLVHYLYQYGVPYRAMIFWTRMMINPHLVLLTQDELIWICEDERIQQMDTNYGAIYVFMPLKRITDVRLEKTESFLRLHIHLNKKSALEIRYVPEAQEQVAELQRRIIGSIHAVRASRDSGVRVVETSSFGHLPVQR